MSLTDKLNEMSGKELVVLYNSICEDGDEVTKFRSKKVAVEKIASGFDEGALLIYLDKEAENVPSEETGKRARTTVNEGGVLITLNEETRSRCALDIIAAIEKLGDGATVEAVTEEAARTHVAPRSQTAQTPEQKKTFVRGYITHMLRKGFIEEAG